eukprot:CAMPEP_0170326394 /NCGR_PEP_ID=MMETSP0116_2-20130129/64073_1 /TAXON_ID=400756 /ORGANISM="Durinskia baltica, Strain CSIRO CS-38" /LENGTH=118 /DNA_ID=CAMNT_0010579449 /DNA_START=83 /DNA_END=437 /DNA_ORIENTATION=+
MATASRATEIARLYRQTLRAAEGLTDYNFRSYFQRRAREDFRRFASMQRRGAVDAAGTGAFLESGKETLAMLKRQALVSSLYEAGPSAAAMAQRRPRRRRGEEFLYRGPARARARAPE